MRSNVNIICKQKKSLSKLSSLSEGYFSANIFLAQRIRLHQQASHCLHHCHDEHLQKHRHSFINENGLLVNVFDPTLQLFHDLWTFCLPIAMATIFKHLFAYCFVLVERRCHRSANQGFKRVPHTLDHSDITFEKGMPTKNEL